ncbi:MAG: hypothetical protein KAQ94_08580 [Arcobacteraceae bacterium]|nr:hypothetical protein [Arcobacteraceae bacterium]
MAVDSVEVNSAIGIDGNSYTTAISNDKLTNEDFLTLMLEEMKMQDPTKPMDSAALMDSQLQMSTIESNMAMSEAMASLQASYANSALSTAAGLIGNIVENGELGDDGLVKSYKVETVENIDGEMYVNTRQLTGLVDNLVSIEGDTALAQDYDSNGYIYEDGEMTNIRIQLDEDGRFVLDETNNIILLDDLDEIITDTAITDKYKYNGTAIVYSEDITTISMASISKVR